MKKMIIAMALALGACTAAQPALANDFGGVYVSATAGLDDVTKGVDRTDVVYGANAGVNVPVGERVIVGVEATLDNVFERREVGASARLGYAASPSVLLYGEVGYANYKDAFNRKLDGVRYGGGIEYNISPHTFISAEYRRTDYEGKSGKNAGLVGVGIRF